MAAASFTEPSLLHLGPVAHLALSEHPPILKPSISYQLPPDNKTLFVGRSDILEKLSKRFARGGAAGAAGDRGPVILTACRGMGGVGKSWIATRFLHDKTYVHKLFFNAEYIESLESQYVNLALQLRLLVPEDLKTIPKKEVIARVKEYLERLPEPMLLVYDNATHYDALHRFMPRSGDVLITTREGGWPADSKVDVDVMSVEDARALVRKILGEAVPVDEDEDEDEDEVKRLITILGKLPLAITQACAYIRQMAITITDYLVLYEDLKMAMLADGSLEEGHHHENVWLTFTLSMRRIQEINPRGVELLHYAGFLAPAPIPRSLLGETFAAKDENLKAIDCIAFDRAISTVENYSLFSFDYINKTVLIHRVVQEVIQQQLMNQDRMKENKIQVLEVLLPSLCNDFLHAKAEDMQENLEHLRQVLPHLRAITLQCEISKLRDYVDYGDGRQEAKERKKRLRFYYAHLLEYSAACARSCGDFNITDQETLLKKAESLMMCLVEDGGDSGYCVRCRNALARAYQDVGRAEEGRALLECLLPMQKRVKGTENLEYAETLVNLGTAHYQLRDFHKAKERYMEALGIRRRLAATSMETIQALGNLALVEKELGNTRASLGYWTEALPAILGVYGYEHLETARIYANMAVTYAALNELDSAKVCAENALKIQVKRWGDNHPEVARNRVNLAIVCMAKGETDYPVQRDLLEKALKVQKELYGERHPEVAKGKLALAKVELLSRKYAKSRVLLQESNAVFQMHQGYRSFYLEGILVLEDMERRAADEDRERQFVRADREGLDATLQGFLDDRGVLKLSAWVLATWLLLNNHVRKGELCEAKSLLHDWIVGHRVVSDSTELGDASWYLLGHAALLVSDIELATRCFACVEDLPEETKGIALSLPSLDADFIAMDLGDKRQLTQALFLSQEASSTTPLMSVGAAMAAATPSHVMEREAT